MSKQDEFIQAINELIMSAIRQSQIMEKYKERELSRLTKEEELEETRIRS